MAHLHLEESILGTVADVTGSDEVHAWESEARDIKSPRGPSPPPRWWGRTSRQGLTSYRSEAGGHWLRTQGSSQWVPRKRERPEGQQPMGAQTEGASAWVVGGCRLTCADAAPVDGCDHRFRALEGNRRGGSGLAQERWAGRRPCQLPRVTFSMTLKVSW